MWGTGRTRPLMWSLSGGYRAHVDDPASRQPLDSDVRRRGRRRLLLFIPLAALMITLAILGRHDPKELIYAAIALACLAYVSIRRYRQLNDPRVTDEQLEQQAEEGRRVSRVYGYATVASLVFLVALVLFIVIAHPGR
jgi:hypothetical protein